MRMVCSGTASGQGSTLAIPLDIRRWPFQPYALCSLDILTYFQKLADINSLNKGGRIYMPLIR